jgi:acyl-CoA reductase-like NAD-dependent aldehyde dehydrogenase
MSPSASTLTASGSTAPRARRLSASHVHLTSLISRSHEPATPTLQRHQPEYVLHIFYVVSNADPCAPANGKVICKVAEGTPADIDRAVKVARHTFETKWGLKSSGSERGKLLNRLADLMEQRADDLAALEALDNGKTFTWARGADVAFAINTIRYYAGWADKNHGQAIEVRPL